MGNKGAAPGEGVQPQMRAMGEVAEAPQLRTVEAMCKAN
jgi:hypothetical protein